DPAVPTLDHLQLYVGHQVNPGSSFPEFAPGGPTFEREAGDDEFLLSEYNVDSAFDLMLPAEQLPLWPEWRQVLIVGSVKQRDGSLLPVAWGASKVGGTAGRVNRYDIILHPVDEKFNTAPGCVAWNAGLLLDVGAQCPGPVCVPQNPTLGFVDMVCDGVDADCDSKPATTSVGSCMREYQPTMGRGLCNLIDHATCNELEAKAEGYLCDTQKIAEATCLALDHCGADDNNGRYANVELMSVAVKYALQKIDAKCEIPVDAQGVPCGGPATRMTLEFGSTPDTCAMRWATRYVDPRYATIGAWKVQLATSQPSPSCAAHYELTSVQPGALTQGTVLLGVHRMADQLRVGITVEIKPKAVAVDTDGVCLDPGAAAQCIITNFPTACFL
ncbi:MAG: hypothetical protein KBG15_16415, partial [Kofleriaceae bacterium]|nr:hypothetical protein [Kofleriaceae bacterium]